MSIAYRAFYKLHLWEIQNAIADKKFIVAMQKIKRAKEMFNSPLYKFEPEEKEELREKYRDIVSDIDFVAFINAFLDNLETL